MISKTTKQNQNNEPDNEEQNYKTKQKTIAEAVFPAEVACASGHACQRSPSSWRFRCPATLGHRLGDHGHGLPAKASERGTYNETNANNEHQNEKTDNSDHHDDDVAHEKRLSLLLRSTLYLALTRQLPINHKCSKYASVLNMHAVASSQVSTS